jgi:hypothetical protein
VLQETNPGRMATDNGGIRVTATNRTAPISRKTCAFTLMQSVRLTKCDWSLTGSPIT